VPCLGLLMIALLAADPLGPGDHFRKLDVDGRERSYFVHLPPQYDAGKTTKDISANELIWEFFRAHRMK